MLPRESTRRKKNLVRNGRYSAGKDFPAGINLNSII
jgi:hypothetical protein